jgi:hypothetical protein
MPTPRENVCPIRIRLESAYPTRRTEIARSFDLDQDPREGDTTVESIVLDLVLPFLEQTAGNERLAQAIRNQLFRAGAVNREAKAYFGLDQSSASAASEEP